MPARPIVTLTTDFGLKDHYVGAMKGVLLSRCPDAQIQDISHAVEPFSIAAGAYTISQAAPFFPHGTVHVVVIDPGVGTPRKPIVLKALNQLFVAPDNGVLSLIAARDPGSVAYEITNSALWLPSPSSTFHGRDIFAPTAAALAAKTALPEDTGPLLASIERLDGLQPENERPGIWRGIILSVDHFGNVITNFESSRFARIASQPFTLQAGSDEISDFRRTFGAAPPGVCFAYFGSSGYVEIGINQRSAAAALSVRPGEKLLLRVTID